MGDEVMAGNNPKRSVSDMKYCHVYTELQGIDGWVVTTKYHDGKYATFAIDKPAPGVKVDMLQTVARAIKSHLRGSLR